MDLLYGCIPTKYLLRMIELRNVGKSYRSNWYRPRASIHALDAIDLRIEPGTALGVIGLNGAGKSTLLRILMGFVEPDRGEAEIAGRLPRSYVESQGIAYVPERVSIPGHWTVRFAMRIYAMLGRSDDAWNRIDGAIERLGLTALADRRIGTLSKGNLQRVALAQAILGDCRIMVLDEPTEGLDPLWITELRSILQDWRAADPERVLVLASHNLTEVSRLTDRSIVLHNGTLRGEIGSDSSREFEAEFLEVVGSLEDARA